MSGDVPWKMCSSGRASWPGYQTIQEIKPGNNGIIFVVNISFHRKGCWEFSLRMNLRVFIQFSTAVLKLPGEILREASFMSLRWVGALAPRIYHRGRGDQMGKSGRYVWRPGGKPGARQLQHPVPESRIFAAAFSLGFFSWDGGLQPEAKRFEPYSGRNSNTMTQLLPRQGESSLVISFDHHDRFSRRSPSILKRIPFRHRSDAVGSENRAARRQQPGESGAGDLQAPGVGGLRVGSPGSCASYARL
jgi:hypothetical protein